MNKTREIEPKLRIQGRRILTYGIDKDRRPPAREHIENSEFTRSKGNKSMFSKGSRKRLNNILNNWLDTVVYARQYLKKKDLTPINKFTFITLTLPSGQMHCDKLIKRECLNPFIIELQREYGMRNYIWKAEPQQNGNLHFHLLSQTYIDAIELRLIWLFHVNRLGYVNEFRVNHQKFLANCTDVHYLSKINDVASYVSKYMGKTFTPRMICGHTWGRSDGLDKLQPYTFTQTNDLQEWYWMVYNSTENNRFTNEHCAILTMKKRFNLRTMPVWAKVELKNICEVNLQILNSSPVQKVSVN